MRERWHLITPEYPPQPGGVSDYTQLVARGLATAGDIVHVWCPGSGDVTTDVSGVSVHREMGSFRTANLRRTGRLLDRLPRPRRLLVQWVPHGYGRRSMNVAFCLWLWQRSRVSGDRVELMVHEPFLAFGEGSRTQDAAAAVHRVMVAVLLRAARRVWVSIPAWKRAWRPYALGRPVPFTWLPVPSNVPVVNDTAGVHAVRARFTASGELLVGHFGTVGGGIEQPLRSAIVAVLRRRADTRVILIGHGGAAVHERLVREHPDLGKRVIATGALAGADVSRHLSACDIMLQPYPDGVSARRTSAMAGLAHRRAIVTTAGRLTEPLWAESAAVTLVPASDPSALADAALALLADARERQRLGAAAAELYQDRFDLRHTITALRDSAADTVTDAGRGSVKRDAPALGVTGA
ncbi:MAG: glycosyltransferase [Gemmatimonadaceae bacterium]